jgi:signal transduction histidine kinase/ActR/RegA family two-component response regulator
MLSPPDAHEGPFCGAGEIRALLRSIDWSSTPLGAVETWPKSLIGFVHLVLAMPTPAIVFWGPEHTQLYNEGYAAIMGPLHPKYFGAACAECWPDTYPAIEPEMRKVLAGGAAKYHETHFPVTRYGFTEEAYFTLTFSPLRDDAGKLAGIFQPIVEVTESVLAARRAETLHALAQVPSAAGAIAILSSSARDVPFAAIYLWNDAEQRLEVAAASDGLEGHDCAALHVAAREAFDTFACERIDDFGFAPVGPWGAPTPSAFVVPLRQSRRGVVIFGISPRLRFDDAYRRFLESAAATFESAGERAILVAREASARREADLQKERLASLFMQAPMPVCVLRGPEHVIELANPAMCELWRRPHAEVIERPVFEAVPHVAGQVFRGFLDDVLRTGHSCVGKELTAQFQAPFGGAPRDVYFNFVYEPLRDVSGDTIGVFVVAFDVTDEVLARGKMAEVRDAAERENRRKDEFLAMLGHELRNPLAAMVTSVALIRSRLPTSSPVAHNVDVIERQANTLQRMVNDLLEVARITEGKIELHRRRIDLVEIVDCALESSREHLDGQRHEVTFSRPPAPTHVLADPVRIEQVIVNLLTNAAKYTNAGGRIAVTVDQLGDRVELRVRDNGIGISEDLQPRLFDLFQQGARDSARSEGGLGLGLTIVRRLVELHGGTVEARSDGPGHGSEFVVALPWDERAPTVTTAATSDHQRPAAANARKILVVDDNKDAAEALAEALEIMGHEPRIAFDGPSALRVSAEWRPDVIFLDIGLPGMDGYDVAREISRRAGRRPTLVALTGYGQASDRAKAGDAGFDHHFVKPASLPAIESVLDSLKSD